VIDLLRNPFSLAPGFTGSKQPSGNKPMIDEALGQINGEGVWVAPFIMAAINTKNIHRSNFLLNHAYGQDFVYDEMLITGAGAKGEQIANHVAGDKSLGSDSGPKPGEGPSKEERESGMYDVLFLGEDTQGNRLNVSVKGDKDPGYGSTSKMISECAVCLLLESKETVGGIWTPAPAFGTDIITRLQANAGLMFAVE
jgi:short subunit dehydrogenase-like uncharacterized protein